MGRIVAVANQKGGVGKTTTAVNLAAALAMGGRRILLIDTDPQAHATSGLGVDKGAVGVSLYDVLVNGLPLTSSLIPTSIRGLDLAPGSIHLAGGEVELVSLPSREFRLRDSVRSVRGWYELTLVDCPPSLGLLTVNALVASDEVLIPIQCEFYALEGLSQLMESVHLIRGNLNPGLRLGGILLTMFDARTNLSEQVAAEVRTHFPGRVYQSVIPRSVRVAEAPSHGMPVVLYDPASRGAQAYAELAKEVIARVGEPTTAQ